MDKIITNMNAKYMPALQVVWGAVFLAILSQISIPVQPVPITLQTVGVILVGLTYTPRLALLGMLTYLGMGLMGLPVFANFSAGPAVLMGPTAGYLMGFPVAAFLMAWCRERFTWEGRFHLVALGIVGHGVILALGVTWLSTVMTVEKAVTVGFFPFILTGMVKGVMSAGLVAYFRR